MNEVHGYVAGGVVAFLGLTLLALGAGGWLSSLLLIVGLAAVALGAVRLSRHALLLGIEIEDAHLHPVPVLDEPKGTYDLISGMTVRVRNDSAEPIGVRVDTLLYHRNAWKWDRPVPDAARRTLLSPSVVRARTTKDFIVRNRTRLPTEIVELGPDHFVKLVVQTAGLGTRVHRVFLGERFELPQPTAPTRTPADSDAQHPLLPFGEELESSTGDGKPQRPRFAVAHHPSETGNVVKIHPLRESDDSLEGLIDEINAELEEETSQTS